LIDHTFASVKWIATNCTDSGVGMNFKAIFAIVDLEKDGVQHGFQRFPYNRNGRGGQGSQSMKGA
jgi:hypothetical protein